MDTYENHHYYYTMRKGEGASEAAAWELAYMDCEAEAENKAEDDTNE